MKLKVSEAADKLLLSYDFPRRIYCSKVYPIPAPNGSTIIITGHELGIGITWRGGRPFKPHKPEPPKPKTNGTSNETIMIIDSDEDAPPPDNTQPPGEVEFEDEEHELDPSEPFYDILQGIDLPLGAKVLAISVPSVPSDTPQSSTTPVPPILKKHLVVAAVCSDCTTRIIALPLAPPPPRGDGQKGSGKTKSSIDEPILVISGAATHQGIASDIAITFTSQAPSQGSRGGSGQHDITMDVEDEPKFSPSRRGSQASARSKARTSDGWDILLATYSQEASGMLFIYRIPILEEKTQTKSIFKFSAGHTFPIQRHFLHTHVTNLSFNPSSYPSERHSRLLVSTSSGAVKLYSCISSRAERSSRGRRTSISDSDPVRDSDGKWLISLYPGFSTSPSGIPQRKPIIDAEWVLGGKAIIALMADGEWGIWDIEGAGPGATQSLVRGQSNVQGVTGGALTSFATNGWINTMESKQPSLATREASKPILAPMTPGTRKIREQSLFKNTTAPTPTVSAPTPFTNGSISVTAHSTNARETQPDESIIINYMTQNIIIPSLLSHWRTKVKTAGTFESSARFRPSPLEGINLQGEHQLGLSQFPAVTSSNRTSYFTPASARHPDVLVVAEHRLHILAAPLMPAPTEAEPSKTQEKPTQIKDKDQALLRRGELDVEGMDRILDGMTNGAGKVSGRVSPTKRRRVGFA